MAFLAIFPTRLLSAPSGMLVKLLSASLRSVVAASTLSFWMNFDSTVDVCLWAIFLFLPWNRLTLVLCISVSNFAPRVFTKLLIASDQFGPFSNALGWIQGLRLSWQFFLLGCWVLPAACRSSCRVPHSGLLLLPVLFPFGWTPIVQLMFVCELHFFFRCGTDKRLYFVLAWVIWLRECLQGSRLLLTSLVPFLMPLGGFTVYVFPGNFSY